MAALSEKEFYKLATSISKAIDGVETPVKPKHVRSAIIGTFHESGAKTFWIVALRLPLQENRIAAWKFCYVFHKILREGHSQSIFDSQANIDKIENIGNLWMHLPESYGKLIKLYCNLLVERLNFHKRNPIFSGNLTAPLEDLEKDEEYTINTYFQLCTEMFDYVDCVLELGTEVFSSWTSSRALVDAGQCRLQPMVLCIEDTSKLYEHLLKLMYKLHLSLEDDVLAGHRERFARQFQKLKHFYHNARLLQYFRDLVTIPVLPENPPNFHVQADLIIEGGTYIFN